MPKGLWENIGREIESGKGIIMQKRNSTELQDLFLNQVRKENVAVTIHLLNGFQIKGMVKGFDNFTVILDVMGKQQLVYKHAVSTITPARPVNTFLGKNEGNVKEEPKE
jgi:host factor-I protein